MLYYLEVQTDYLHFDTQSLTLQFSQCRYVPTVESRRPEKSRLRAVVFGSAASSVRAGSVATSGRTRSGAPDVLLLLYCYYIVRALVLI